MPVNDRRHVEIIGQVDEEALAGVQNQPLATGAIDQSEDGRRAPVDVQRACGRAQPKWGRL